MSRRWKLLLSRYIQLIIIISDVASIAKRHEQTAASFCWFDTIAKESIKEQSFLDKADTFLKETSTLLESNGFDKIAYEDFLDVCFNTLHSLRDTISGYHEKSDIELAQSLEGSLLSVFQSAELSNSIVMHFRFLVSAYMKQNSFLYLPFIDAEYPCMTMEQFCSLHVESMGRESDHIHIAALSQALRVKMKVAYMDSSEASDTVFFHEFTPDVECDFLNGKWLTLLYRPGHYDIIYLD
jgi:ubiquitin thioesterase protein OTUB1